MKNNFLWGVVLIALGILLILKTINIFTFDIFFEGWWSLFLIVPGVIGIFTTKDKIGNLIIVAIGGLLLISAREIIGYREALGILVGLAVISVGFDVIRKNSKSKKNNKIVDRNIGIFGGPNLKPKGEYNGGNYLTVFGGIDLDLRDAKINKDIVITTTVFMAGIDIKVSDDVCVEINVTNIFGGVEDKTSPKKNAKHTIRVEGTCIFGGIDIK